jgi:hypothetical protein
MKRADARLKKGLTMRMKTELRLGVAGLKKLLKATQADNAALKEANELHLNTCAQQLRRAEDLDKKLDEARAKYAELKRDLQHEIHTLELSLARANGYVDRVRDETAVGRERVVQPEIREAVMPTGPQGEHPEPVVSDRDFERSGYRSMTMTAQPDRKPWWAR